MIVAAALQEDVDAVGLSIMSGAHMTLMPAIVDLLKEKGAGEVVVIGGGIIPQDDVPKLKQAGIAEVFLPGSTTQAIVDWIRGNVHPGAAAA
jgi:methylmalonyl-CoA mutase C-terminal domain/subunit